MTSHLRGGLTGHAAKLEKFFCIKNPDIFMRNLGTVFEIRVTYSGMECITGIRILINSKEKMAEAYLLFSPILDIRTMQGFSMY